LNPVSEIIFRTLIILGDSGNHQCSQDSIVEKHFQNWVYDSLHADIYSCCITQTEGGNIINSTDL